MGSLSTSIVTSWKPHTGLSFKGKWKYVYTFYLRINGYVVIIFIKNAYMHAFSKFCIRSVYCPSASHLKTSRLGKKVKPRPPYPRGNSPRYPLDRSLNGLQSRSRYCGEQKYLASAGNRTDRAIPTHNMPCSLIKTIILPLAFYVCEIWYFTLRE